MSPDITRRRTLGLAASTVGTALAGCLGTVKRDGSGGGTGTLGDPAEHVEVETMSIPQPTLEPALVHIEPGGSRVGRPGPAQRSRGLPPGQRPYPACPRRGPAVGERRE